MLASINRNLLKSVMLADGAFSLAAGAGLLALSGQIATLAGPAVPPGIVIAVGVFLLGWGLFHLVSAQPAHPAESAVRFAIAGDAAWIIGSAAILLAGRDGLSAAAIGVITVAAVAVFGILLLKMAGLHRQRAAMA
ncbi:hypothetical protein [Mycoplana sp. MJR14]|uniref:hypothetical protein n=1 Tax=Mycoplana sp. MJR14 TaxID=3032583 RepID=UPI0023DBDD69|nr:hypothetical protein [Mycoplana sp. MJR14]MDF1634210.1 hypothetical protein [Mycoplana sp. MJR14]